MTDDEQWVIEEKYEGSTENKAAVRRDFARLNIGEPVAYVIGCIPFLGLRIYLDSKPLIPRPETEWWVEELSNSLRHRLPVEPSLPQGIAEFHLLDLCAGSGAIGCAILKQTDARVAFGELMPEHEATIQKNIEENGLDAARADVRIGDLFEPFAREKFDVIATNPPYIPDDRELDPGVAQFEPAEALRAGSDGLSLIRRIAAEAPAHMNEGGELWLECDSEHAEVAKQLIEAGGAKRAELRTDPYGRPRLIVGYY